MSEEKRWKIVELSTNGWTVIDPTSTNLTKEECDKKLDVYLQQGIAPNRLQAILNHIPDDGDRAMMTNAEAAQFPPLSK